jgi:prevent-host-death family protein
MADKHTPHDPEMMPAAVAKNSFGKLLHQATRHPVGITSHGRTVAFVISPEEYKRFVEFEDLIWRKKAEQAESEGYLSTDDSEKLLNDMLNNAGS